jgi:hypothetical protein
MWSKSAFFASLRSCYVPCRFLLRPLRSHHVFITCTATRALRPLRLNYALITFLLQLERPFYACTTHLSRSVFELYINRRSALFFPPSTKVTICSVKNGRPQHDSMAVRYLEQTQLSTAAYNVEVAGNGAIRLPRCCKDPAKTC